MAIREELYEFIAPSSRPLVIDPVDGDTDGKKLWLKGICVQGEVKNANGRVYPRQEIHNAVTSIMQRIKETGPVPGELDHPEGLTIAGQNVSHCIHEMWMEGSDGCGKMLLIDEGNGKIAASMIRAGINLGVSSRGSGSVDARGHVSEFDIVTIDIVTTPSAPNAFPKPMYESLDQLLNARFGRELKYLADIRGDASVQKHFQKTARDFLTEIRDRVTWSKK
jgi:Prohead core protein serine protease